MKKPLSRKRINPYAHEFTGVKYTDTSYLQLFKYNSTDIEEIPNFKLDDFHGFPNNGYQYWLNIHGLHDIADIQTICNKVGIHNLVIQDILDVNQRPKLQEYDNYIFFTLKSVLPPKNLVLEQDQVSFVLGSNFLISFQERANEYFGHIRERLRNKLGIVREQSPDYLMFLLIESILDNYFSTLNYFLQKSELVSIIELGKDPSPEILKTIEFNKQQVNQIKKNILPIREVVSKIERGQSGLIKLVNLQYYYELKDLKLTIIEECDQIESKLDSSINLFFSIQGYRMNLVMKTLTLIGSIFIPLTFIVGIYGMNFKFMPELNWYFGYFAVWLVFFGVIFGMLFYFKKKNWF